RFRQALLRRQEAPGGASCADDQGGYCVSAASRFCTTTCLAVSTGIAAGSASRRSQRAIFDLTSTLSFCASASRVEAPPLLTRSEERRVGKERRSGWRRGRSKHK